MEIKKLNSNFVLPEYSDNCFSNIPNTIFNLFGIKTEGPTISKDYFEKYINKGYESIIVFLIDALGFYQWKRHASHSALFSQLDNKECLKSITSVFPSTTAAALNTISSGLTPAEHGLFEWFLYLQEIDKTIETLSFKELGNDKRDSLVDQKANPKVLFDYPTIYELLEKHHVKSSSFTDKAYANSAYSKASRKGSENVTFVNFSDLVIKLKNQLCKSKEKSYIFVYWDKLDTLSHKYGPNNDACRVELSKISHLFLTEVIRKVNKRVKQKTLLIVIADHGQIATNSKETVYLNQDRLLMKALQKDRKRKIILPTGGPRDVFLHIKESELEIVQKHLKGKLKNKADVVKTNEAIALGLFGEKEINNKFRNRLGNLIILPHENYTIWREFQHKKFEFLGHHGGLSKEEMVIPFSICGLHEIT